jgi:hypothetical protein
MDKSVTFTEAELDALDDAADAGLKSLRIRIDGAGTDAARQVFADAADTLLDARKKIQEARHRPT